MESKTNRRAFFKKVSLGLGGLLSSGCGRITNPEEKATIEENATIEKKTEDEFANTNDRLEFRAYCSNMKNPDGSWAPNYDVNIDIYPKKPLHSTQTDYEVIVSVSGGISFSKNEDVFEQNIIIRKGHTLGVDYAPSLYISQDKREKSENMFKDNMLNLKVIDHITTEEVLNQDILLPSKEWTGYKTYFPLK